MNVIDEFLKDLNTRRSAEREKTNYRMEGRLVFAQEVPAEFTLTLAFPSTKRMINMWVRCQSAWLLTSHVAALT